MMLEKAEEFRYYKDKLKLPIAKGTISTDNMIILFIKNTNQALDILDNPLIQRLNYMKYFKPEKYNAKMFNSNVKAKLTPSDIKDMNLYVHSLKMNFVSKESQVNNKNVVVDTSQFQELFFEKSEGRDFKLISSKYIELYLEFMNKACDLKHPNKCIFININDWGISKDNITKNFVSVHRLLNPISIFYNLMKRDIELVSSIGNVDIVILDGNNGWFTFNFSRLNESSYKDLYKVFQKVKSDAISIDDNDAEDNDTHSDKPIIIDDEDSYDVDKENKDEDDEEEKEDPRSEEDDQEKLLQAAQEIEDNFESVKRSMPSNKRNEELREKQKQIKLNQLTLGEIKEGTNVDFKIDEVDLSDKIFAPTKTVKKIRFDNFNKSYVKNCMERDIMNVFLGLNDRSLPIYVRNVTKEDTSTPMDLKDTYHIELEGEDRVRHSVTIDIPKVYDGNYFFLGGNRKQFNNQQFLKPVVKIAPDTVQVCTNYNKIFMYRYGEIISPKVTIFKKIVINNPKYFNVKRGNATKLNNGRKTSIEYDSIAKDFVSIEIVGKNCKLELDQKFYDDLIEKKVIESIGDDWTYCFYDAKPENKALTAIPINMETDSDGRDSDSPDDENEFESAKSNGVVDLFCYMFKKKTGLDFWELAGDKDKAGKRFMYTRCKVMDKFIPTIIFLSYFEGLTTVMNKAGIKYQFSEKRIRTSPNQGIIQFSDGYLIFERNPTQSSLLMNGLSVVSTKDYTFEDFNGKDVYLDIFAALFDSRILASGLDAYYDNMIDPITKDILNQLDYPTDFVSLIIFASNLLADNSYSSEISMDIYRVRNMEMVSAFLYKIIANAYSDYKRSAMNKTPRKISVPKNALIKEMLTSNVLEDYSVINPIVEKKKLHLITCKGPSGVNLDRAYTEARRCYDPSMVGLIAMTTPPDANVGVQRELTAEPKVIDSRGLIDLKKPVDEMNDVNIFSGPEMLTPLSIQYDDCIR